MSDTIDLIPLRNNLLLDFKFNETKENIIARIVQLKLNDIKYKFDNEFLTLICNLIEHVVNKQDKISKLDLCISIFQQYYNLNNDEIDLLKKNIDYIHSNNNIKKINGFKIKCGDWFKKKV